jgi:hypothetical protein
LFLAWLAFYVLTASGRITPGDEETMFQVTEGLTTRGKLDVNRDTVAVDPLAGRHDLLPHQPTQLSNTIETTSGVPGVGGQLYSKYGMGQSLIALPFWLMGCLLNCVVPGLGMAYAGRLTASFLNAVATAISGWLVADAGLALGYRLRTALGLSAAYGLTTMAFPFAKTWYSEPSVTALLLLAFTAQIRARSASGGREAWLAGAAIAGAILFRITSMIWLPALALGALSPGTGHTCRRAIALLAPAVLAVGLTGAYNALRFGSPLVFGYPEAQWDNPLVAGLVGLLGSPGKGLFLYNPVLLLGLGGLVLWLSAGSGRRAEGVTVLVMTALTLAYIAPYRFWTGGWNWGPRFLLPLVPLLLLPAGALLEAATTPLVRASWLGLCSLGFVVNLPAVLVDHSRYLISASEQDPDGFYDRSIWDFHHSPVVWQWPMVGDVSRMWSTQRVILAQGAQRYPNDGLGVVQREEYLRWNAPDFWQVHWLLLGLPMWLPVLASVASLIVLCWTVCQLHLTVSQSADPKGAITGP